MVGSSDQLKSVQLGNSALQLKSLSAADFGIPWYWHGTGVVIINFDPWSELELRCRYDFEIVAEHEEEIEAQKRLYNELSEDSCIYNIGLLNKELRNFLKKFGPVDSR